MVKIGFVVGSLRKDSFSKRWAKNVEELFPSDYEMEYLDFSNLPLYNQDYDGNDPKEYLEFREAVKRQDAIVFVTPEYNRSIPGGFKNAIDVASRPYGENVWDGKPALVITHSISDISGALANHALRQILTFINMPVLQQPEVYLANSQKLLDEQGNVTNNETKDFLKSVVSAFISFTEKILK